MKPGTQIIYIPNHERDAYEKAGIINFNRKGGSEPGFVVGKSKTKGSVFCRYWRITHTQEVLEYDLRTKANSELTPIRNLVEKETVPQVIVKSVMVELGYKDLKFKGEINDE